VGLHTGRRFDGAGLAYLLDSAPDEGILSIAGKRPKLWPPSATLVPTNYVVPFWSGGVRLAWTASQPV